MTSERLKQIMYDELVKVTAERDALQKRIDKALDVLGRNILSEAEIDYLCESASDEADMRAINRTIEILTGKDE